MKRNHRKDIITALVVGFALFATFFGAGNLIFPPVLGELTGPSWWLGFIAFLLTDAGLAVLTVLAAARREGSLEDHLGHLGKWPARIICFLMMFSIGPLLVVPRTAATTYEMSILPLLGHFSPWIFSLVFFALVALLTIRPAAVVDIIGKFLTPVLLLTLLALCVKGIITPIGPVVQPEDPTPAVRIGILYGYQTMDALMAVPIAIIVFKSLEAKGYSGRKEKLRMTAYACLVAFLGLFLVYGGLTFLGATASDLDLGGLGGTELLVEITRRLLQQTGAVVLGVVVFLACLTTAIGIVSAASDYFSGLLKGRIPYSWLVLAICCLGVFLSNLGTSQIIALAEPLLVLIYPVFLTQILLSFFSDRIRNPWVYRGAALGAALFSLLDLLEGYLLITLPFVNEMPLSSVGLAWILPAAAGGLLGMLIPRTGPSSQA